jgi:hypothetical protein
VRAAAAAAVPSPAAASTVPHSVQKWAAGQVALPQLGQGGPKALPHWWQKRAACGLAAPQLGQFTGVLAYSSPSIEMAPGPARSSAPSEPSSDRGNS